MSTKTYIDYKKEYLPGYTGHIPQKNDIFGCTAGDINKLVTNKGEKPGDKDLFVAVSKPYFKKNDYLVEAPPKDAVNEELRFTNKSIKGENWVGGPTSNLTAQHVPGYAGFMPGIHAENLYGKSFANTSANAIHKDHEKGFKHSIGDTYDTQEGKEYSKDNFRLLKKDLEPAEVKDIVDAYNFHDAEFQGIEITEKKAYMDLPTVGYTGHQSMYRMPTTQVNHRKDPFFNINSLRARLNMDENGNGDKGAPENADKPEAKVNGEGAKESALKSTAYREMLGVPDAKKSQMKTPVVGYTGHRMGYRSQNFYGKNFKDCTIQSKIIHKLAN